MGDRPYLCIESFGRRPMDKVARFRCSQRVPPGMVFRFPSADPFQVPRLACGEPPLPMTNFSVPPRVVLTCVIIILFLSFVLYISLLPAPSHIPTVLGYHQHRMKTASLAAFTRYSAPLNSMPVIRHPDPRPKVAQISSYRSVDQ